MQHEPVILSQYTSEEAVNDGILFDITTIDKRWERGILRYITTNLLISKGYMHDNKPKIINVVELLNQVMKIIKQCSDNFTKPKDTFYAGQVEFPSGESNDVFIEMNEHGTYTIMLPEDH